MLIVTDAITAIVVGEALNRYENIDSYIAGVSSSSVGAIIILIPAFSIDELLEDLLDATAEVIANGDSNFPNLTYNSIHLLNDNGSPETTITILPTEIDVTDCRFDLYELLVKLAEPNFLGRLGHVDLLIPGDRKSMVLSTILESLLELRQTVISNHKLPYRGNMTDCKICLYEIHMTSLVTIIEEIFDLYSQNVLTKFDLKSLSN